jgi:hypothetical protein
MQSQRLGRGTLSAVRTPFLSEQQSKALLKLKAFFGSPSAFMPQRIGGRIHSRLRVGIMAAACIFFVWLIRPDSDLILTSRG